MGIVRLPRGRAVFHGKHGDVVAIALQRLVNRVASEDIFRAAQKFALLQEEDDRKDARARAVLSAIRQGFSTPTAMRLDPAIYAYRESITPEDHGLVPPFSNRSSGRRRKPPIPARWRKQRFFSYPPE